MRRTTSTLRRMKIAIITSLGLSVFLLQFGCNQPLSSAVQMSVSEETAAVGDILTYHITIATQVHPDWPVTLTQEFSQPVDIVAAEVDDHGVPHPLPICTASGNQVVCPGLPFRSTPVRVNVTVRAITPGTLDSLATIRFDEDPDERLRGEAHATTTIIENGTPEVSVALTDSPDPVPVGSRLIYTITLTNNTQESISGLTFIDRLPTEVTLISGLPAGCTLEDGAITCSDIGIAGGASVIYQFEVRPTAIGTITNTISLPGQAAIIAETTVNPAEADLAVTVVDSPDPVLVGSLMTYTITVRNNGPSQATGVTLTDMLPSGVDFISASSGQGSCGLLGTIVTCELANDPADPVCPDCAIVTLTVRPTSVGEISNTVSVTASQGDSNPVNNTATENTTVTSTSADLVVTMTDNPDPVAVSNEVTYTVNITNHGPAEANNVFVTDVLPVDADVISITPSQGTCDSFGPVRTCYLESVANGASATVSVVVRPRFAGNIENRVFVSAENALSFADLTESTRVNPPLLPDLSVTVSDSPDPVVENQPLTYTIRVSNNGLGEAIGPTITATLPASVRVDFPGDFNCAPGSGNIVCHTPALGRLPGGGELSQTIVVTPSVPGTMAITAQVTSPGTDANPADNTVTENTTVSQRVPAADISITLSDSPDPVLVDGEVVYNAIVQNHGLATATGIIATLTLPQNANHNEPTLCSNVGGNRVCQIRVPDLANGASSAFSLSLVPTATGSITLNATVVALEEDPSGTNNSAAETTTVLPQQTTADLEIVSVSSSPNPAIVNQQFVYTVVVRNNGLGAATNVMVGNTLDAGLVYDGSPGCSLSGQVVQCGFGNFPAGATTTISLLVHSSVAGSLRNVVSVTAQEADPIPANNSLTGATTIYPADSADLVMSISAVPSPVTISSELTFTLAVQNTGPAAATGVTLTGFTFASIEQLDITTTQGSCSFAPYPLLACNIGTLASGGSATVTIRAFVFELGTLTQTVTATSTNDPNAANNTSTVNVTVNPPGTASVWFTRGQRDHDEVEAREVVAIWDRGGPEMTSNATRGRE